VACIGTWFFTLPRKHDTDMTDHLHLTGASKTDQGATSRSMNKQQLVGAEGSVVSQNMKI
jgi:hypothetical protein